MTIRSFLILFLGIVCMVFLFSGCMSVKPHAVKAQSYFKNLEHVRAPAIYDRAYDGGFYPLFQTTFDDIEALMLVDLADDPLYKSIEVQKFLLEGRDAWVVITERKDGRIDYYYEEPDLMDEERKASVSTLLNQPYFHQTSLQASLEVAEHGLSTQASFVDYENRSIELSIRENRTDSKPTAMLAPVSVHAENPTSFPMVFLDEFNMVAKKGTRVEVVIDKQKRKGVTLPIIVEGKRVYYSRYASDVVAADLLNSGQYVLEREHLMEGTPSVVSGNATYHLAWEHGYPHIRQVQFTHHDSSVTMDFAPALPEIRHMKQDTAVEGRFILTVNSVDGVIGGSYRVSTFGEALKLEVHPLTSWQPPFMGKKWVSTFLHTATLKQDGSDLLIDARWERL
ncbi:MAG: hypothetical protein GX626_08675 [Spirochaetales bacterium]|nr:hypothetical protein [Spirochaetales bacterium]